MIVQRFLRFFTFAMIPLSILGSSLMMPKVGTIHLLPQWLLIIISIPIFLILLLGADLRLKFGLNIKKDLHIKFYIYFLTFWLFYCMISVLWADDKLLGLKEFILFSIVIGLIFCIILYITSVKNLKFIIYVFAIILLINYFVVYLELFYNYHLPSSTLFETGGRLSQLGMESVKDLDISSVLRLKDFASGTFYNPNALGTFIGLTLPLIFSNFVRGGKTNYEKILGIALCIVGVIVSIYVASRILFIVLLLVTSIYFCFYMKFQKKILFSLLVGFLILVLNYLNLPLIYDLNDASLSTRGDLLSLGMERFLNSFLLLGTGAGSFYDANLHNWYAEVLFKFGFLIFFGYLLFYFNILKNLYVISKRATNRELRFLGEGFFVSLCGYIVGSLSDSSRLLAFDSWIIFGLSLVVINMYRRESEYSRNYPLVSQ